MSMLPITPPDYSDGRTKQAFKDETDINRILSRAQKTGTISHINKYQGMYADFSDFDFLESELKLAKGREVFDALPSEIRTEFGQSPAAFFKYVNDPANANDLLKKLPQLAAPGRQMIDVSGRTPPEPASGPQAAKPATPNPGTSAALSGSQGAPQEA